MIGKITRRVAGIGILAIALGTLPASAQKSSKGPIGSPPREQQFITVEQPDADRTKNEFLELLRHYPPTLKNVFRQDPSLLTQTQYLSTYPALVTYLNTHPEIALNPAYYLGGLAGSQPTPPEDRYSRSRDMWRTVMEPIAIFAGFGMAIGLLTWLIRTFLDYRRWNRLSKVQAEVHTRLLDRFNTNEELMAYIATPAGSKFLQSAPISLDTGSRSMGAPLSRIMWALQAGLVMVAGGCGLMLASGRMTEEDYLPLEIMGIIAVALGVGFAVSAAISFLLSSKMGLLDQQRRTFSNSRTDTPEAQ